MSKLILIAVLLCSCVTLAVAQTRIEVATGQKFTLTLDSNPSTGYAWQLATPVDETKVKFLRSVFNAPETDRAGRGRPGTLDFRGCGNRGNYHLLEVRALLGEG